VNPIKVILGVAAVIIVFHLARWGWQEWQLAQPGFHETDCWFSKQVTGDATCGYLVVRENRQAVDSRTIRLPVASSPPSRWTAGSRPPQRNPSST